MTILFANASLALVRGTTWLDTIALTSKETGLPVDLTACTITMRIREDISDDAVVLELSTANGRLTIASATGGEIDLRVEAADTLAFALNDNERAKYVYDAIIDRAAPGAAREPAVKGFVTVHPQVTRLSP